MVFSLGRGRSGQHTIAPASCADRGNPVGQTGLKGLANQWPIAEMKTRRGFLRAGLYATGHRDVAAAGTSRPPAPAAIDRSRYGPKVTMIGRRRARRGDRCAGKDRTRQVIVKVTAAAATISTAIAAVSTVTQVATKVTNQSRRALNAARRTGRLGIAGRGSTDIGLPSSTQTRGNAHRPSSSPSGQARLFRGAGQKRGHQHDERSRQPEQLGGDDGDHGVTHGCRDGTLSLPSFSVANPGYGSRVSVQLRTILRHALRWFACRRGESPLRYLNTGKGGRPRATGRGRGRRVSRRACRHAGGPWGQPGLTQIAFEGGAFRAHPPGHLRRPAVARLGVQKGLIFAPFGPISAGRAGAGGSRRRPARRR